MNISRRLCRAVLAGSLTLTGACAAQALTPVSVAGNAFAFVGDSGNDTRPVSGNAGFFAGPDGVVVVDTGISDRYGRQMIEAIRKVSDRPIALVVVTHAVQEFVFGAGAFAARGTPIGAHQATIDLMKARCQHCLDNLQPLLGDELKGTRLVLPTTAWHGATTINAGGMELELLHYEWAATPGDIAVFDRHTGTLFAGGLLAVDYIPEIRDCDFQGWRTAIAALRELPLRHIVPGHGPVTGRQALDATDGYLSALDELVHRLYRDSSSLIEALERADLPQYAGWAAYDAHHRKNVLHRYLQLEIEDLGGDPRSTALPQR